MWQAAAGIAAALVLIGLVLSFFLKMEVFTPLARIINHLRGIGAGHYDARLDPNRKDEIGQVYTALNQTSETLADNMRMSPPPMPRMPASQPVKKLTAMGSQAEQ